MNDINRHPSSFRDPSGFIFQQGGIYYRQVNKRYKEEYDQLKKSGLYSGLTERKWLLPHEEMPAFSEANDQCYLVLKPAQLRRVSYASEWSFDALKDAALLHLDIMAVAIDHKMVLKDATPYNIQFVGGKPVFIDTLSFANYNETKPWIAYRQFCECFLYPLLLEHYKILYSAQVSTLFPDGIPAATTASLLPIKSRFHPGCWLHVYLAASLGQKGTGNLASTDVQEAAGKTGVQRSRPTIAFNKQKLKNLVAHLATMIRRLSSNDKSPAAWNTYYAETILSQQYLGAKRDVVKSMINGLEVKDVIDLGSNDGYFSRLLADKGCDVLAVDTDQPSINRLYLEAKKSHLNILPLIVDIASPTPAMGFNNKERTSFLDRAESDLGLALALVHHLVIGKNISFAMLADLLAAQCRWLIIEFVPKDDPKVQQMLSSREDVFADYTAAHFESAFAARYQLVQKVNISGVTRSIYLYKRTGL